MGFAEPQRHDSAHPHLKREDAPPAQRHHPAHQEGNGLKRLKKGVKTPKKRKATVNRKLPIIRRCGLKDGGEIVEPAAPVQWKGGSLSSLGNSLGPASQSGLDVLSSVLGMMRLGMKMQPQSMSEQQGQGVFDDIMTGVRSVGSLAPLVLAAAPFL